MAGDSDFLGPVRNEAIAVVQGDHNGCKIEGLTLFCPRKDDIGHLAAPQTLGR